MAKEHFHRAALIQTDLNNGNEYDEGQSYNMYTEDGEIVPSTYHTEEEFKQHARDANEPITHEVKELEKRYVTLTIARDVEIKTHQQEYPWARGMYMPNNNWRVLPGQINGSGKYGPIHSKNLPVPERFANDKQSDYFWSGVRGLANLYLSKFVRTKKKDKGMKRNNEQIKDWGFLFIFLIFFH